MNTPHNDDKPQHPFVAPVRTRNFLTRALLWLSKTDPRLAPLCSRWAQSTQAALGLFVAFTAVMAFGSMYYLASTFHAPNSLVPLLALVYALWIAFLDRELVGSLDRTTAIVRPILAVFIATLTAIPIELALFENRVDQRLKVQYRENNKEQLDQLQQQQAAFDKRRDDLTATLSDLRRQESDWGKTLDAEAVGRAAAGRTGIAGEGPAFRNAQAQQASVRERIAEVRSDLDRLDHSAPDQKRRSDEQFKREEVELTADFPSRYEALDKVIHESAPLYRLSWILFLALTTFECCPTVLKALTPHVDYHHLVKAEIRENVARIDEISDRNYRLAIENPESPQLSVAEKFMISRFSPIPERPEQTPERVVENKPKRRRRESVVKSEVPPPPPQPPTEFDLDYLQALRDSLMPHFPDMALPSVVIKDPDAFAEVGIVAHCRGPLKPGEPSAIEFKNTFLKDTSAADLENVMKHEMVHAWVQSKELTDTATHGHVFILKAKQVGCDVSRYEEELADQETQTKVAASHESRPRDR